MHEPVHVQQQTNKYFAFVRLYASVSIKLLFLHSRLVGAQRAGVGGRVWRLEEMTGRGPEPTLESIEVCKCPILTAVN